MKFLFGKQKIDITNEQLVEFSDEQPIFNLIFHFHCIEHEKLYYAITKLEQHISKFNGYKIITLSSPNDRLLNNNIAKIIINRFKKYEKIIFIPVINDLKTRESSHFFEIALPLLITLADMPDKKSYTFYGHSKGCTHQQNDYGITCWVNMLYKYNLDFFYESIKPNLILNKYKFIGCLKINSLYNTMGSNTHYAGTFFWFDSDIIRTDWLKYKKHPLALEMWPNTIVHDDEMLSVWNIEPPEENNFYRRDFWYNLVYHKIIDPPTTIESLDI